MHFFNNSLVSDRLFGSSLVAKLSFTLLGILLLSISAKVSIPFFPVPMTFQTLVVYFIASTAGMIGFSSTILYVLLGLAGLPIFAAGGGLVYISSPTFGFLYGMVLASFFIAYSAKNFFRDKILSILICTIIGAVIIFSCGILHLSIYIGFSKAVTLGFNPFIYSETLKIILAVLITYILLKKTKQIN